MQVMKKIKVMTIFGTRPEAVKMAPLVKKLEDYPELFESIVTVTAQHREMLDQVLADFSIVPNYDLDIMKEGQTLTEITSRVLEQLTKIIEEENPKIVLVHGDTTTSVAAALAGFYEKIEIGHVEAGLRTWEKYSPFPEEMNRQLVDTLSDIYFAPTKTSEENLLKENHAKKKIYVTGNTSIDAMKYTIQKDYHHPTLDKIPKKQKIIMLTMHRRENWGESMVQVFKAIKQVVENYSSVEVIFPMHKNPLVRQIAEKYLSGNKRIHLIEPLDVKDFQNFIARSYLILTDSGGIQEEAPSLGVPVLVLRDTTERPEGIAAGTLKLIGTKEEKVIAEITELLENSEQYEKMAKAQNPYGDRNASQRIIEAIACEFGEQKDSQKYV